MAKEMIEMNAERKKREYLKGQFLSIVRHAFVISALHYVMVINEISLLL